MFKAIAAALAARPWRLALYWLLFLGPFFFLTYGLSNWLTSLRADVGVLVFEWEKSIPFLPWTIVPYWSIDILYGLSLFICTSRQEVNTHGRRLLAAQLLAVAGFLLFPLQFSFARSDPEGFFGFLFTVLAGFDKPFNQAPSLHIALLIILWVCYAAHLRGLWLALLHGWFFLIGVSVLTTWQHHFIDVPTGLWLGLFCLLLFPEQGATVSLQPLDRQRVRMALYYFAGALVMIALIAFFGGWIWVLLWPAGALTLVGLVYLIGDPMLFGKRNGRMSATAWCLYAPYLAGAWLNSRIWTHRQPQPNEIGDGVWLGRIPARQDFKHLGLKSLADVCAELPVMPHSLPYQAVPMLDMVIPDAAQIEQAAQAIADLEQQRPTLVFCALGYSRSAMAIAAWLLRTQRAATLDEAIAMIQAARPQIVLSEAHRQRLQEWAEA